MQLTQENDIPRNEPLPPTGHPVRKGTAVVDPPYGVRVRGRLRVLHVAQPHEGGVAACVAQLAQAQHARGLDVQVACPSEGPLAAALADARVPVEPWEASRSPGRCLPRELGRLREVLGRRPPDLVHLHSAKAGLAGRLLLRGRLPTVFQPHAWSFDAVTGATRTATVAWERTAGRWTSLLVCVSEAERLHGSAIGVRATRSVVVPNGVDLGLLTPAGDADRTRARQELGLPAGPLAVCVGRLTEQKGQDLLLTAWPIVRRVVPAARLALVGEGPLRKRLVSLADESVLMVGARADVPLWLAAADVVVLPSRWEGMPLVPLEAMARCRSVVASDVTGVREAVPAAAGAVVPSGDGAALSAALVERLRSPQLCEQEGRAGRAHVQDHHDVRATTDRITAAYTLLARL